MSATEPVSLTSEWFLKAGSEEAAIAALKQVALDVQLREPDTLAYLVHTPYQSGGELQSLPPSDPQSVLFFEIYKDAAAFHAHVNGPIFTVFVQDFGDLFHCVNGKPYTTVNFLSRRAGFVRSDKTLVQGEAVTNQYPSVMFEVIAKDQAAMKAFYTDVFEWSYDTGTANFAYIQFPDGPPALLGGIGQAQPKVAGFDPGTNFYLLVDDLQAFVDRAVAAGGKGLMPPTAIDGYNFAMFEDIEGNPIGLIEPFSK